MEQYEIDFRAKEVFEANRLELMKCLYQFHEMGEMAAKMGVVHVPQLYAFILVLGDSLKAAKYRELTGKPLDRKEMEAIPVVANSPQEFVEEWMKWFGEEEFGLDDTLEGLPVVVFVGSGHATLGLNTRDFTEQEFLQIEEKTWQERKEYLEESKGKPNMAQELSAIANEKKKLWESIRRPKLAQE